MSVKERLREYLKYKKISATEFGKTIGVSAAFVNSIRVSIQPDKIESIALNYPDFNTGWLLTGEGEMLKNNQSQSITTPVLESTFEYNEVPLLPISAQGGSLNDFTMSIKDVDCEKIISPIKGATFAITVTGDSMAPEYPSGSQILIKKINDRAFIEWGRVYVLDTCNGVIVKRIVPSNKEGCIQCISDNNPMVFAPFEVDLNDVFGIYRVMLCMSVK